MTRHNRFLSTLVNTKGPRAPSPTSAKPPRFPQPQRARRVAPARLLGAPIAIVALAALSASGCGLLVRAVKGEVTPIGADQASESDVGSLGRTLSETNDTASATKAFTDLSSIYLYKCVDSPTRVPKDGKTEIRQRAGETLVAAMEARLSKYAPGQDVTADALAERAASLQKQVATKCDADKLAKQDPGGKLATAAALTTVEGRTARAEALAAELEPELQAALGEEKNRQAVWRWTTQICPRVLPTDSYCVPRALDVLHEAGRWDTIASNFVGGTGGDTVLPLLADRHGADTIAAETKTFLMSAAKEDAASTSRTAMDRMTAYLRDSGAWGSCSDHEGSLTAKIKGEDVVSAQWAIDQIVADKCTDLGKAIVKALGSDSMSVRAKAAWAVGELDLQKAKRHVERLQWSDPGYSDGCYCYPVRDAARNAYNKLELQAS